MLRRVRLFLPPALLLTACAAPLPYQPLALDLPAAQAAFRARALDDADLQAFLQSAGVGVPAAGAPWPRASVAVAASWFSPALAVAQARWSQALAQRAVAVQRPPGTLDTLLEHHSQTDGTRSSPWTVALGFEFTLPAPARQQAIAAQADADVAQARLELASVAWTVQQGVARAWTDAQVARARHALLNRVLQLRSDMHASLQVQVRLGGRSVLDEVAAAQLENEARQALGQAEGALQARLQALRAAAGLPAAVGQPGPGFDLGDQPMACALPARDRAEQRALANRLDLQVAQTRFVRADAALRLAVARQYPELSLHPGYEWDQGDQRLRIGVALPLNLPSAHPAAIAQAEADRAVQAQQALALQQQVLHEVAQAQQAVQQANDQLAALVPLDAARARHRQQVQVAVRLGELDQQDLRQVALEDLQHALQALDLQAAVAQACLQLQDTLQIPLEQP